MPRFSVQVESDNAEQARGELNAAGIPTIGPAFAYFTLSPETTSVTSRHVIAVLDAEIANKAESRVRSIVGPDCEIGPTRQYGAEADL
jgi:hypothetical protein